MVLIGFLVAPSGVQIWDDAHPAVRALGIVLVGAVALLGAYGPRVVIGLTALAAGIATVYLAAFDSIGTGTIERGCSPSLTGMGVGVVFAVVAAVVSALSPTSG